MTNEETNKHGGKLLYALLFVALAMAALNQVAISGLSQSVTANAVASQQSAQQSAETTVTYNAQNLQAAVDAVIPKGKVTYGSLVIDYDKPVEALDMMAKMDGDLYPDGTIKFSDLSPEAQQRYIQIGMSIACEYCCGAKTLVQRNGQPACGCAHSAAMRGLAKYLLKNTEMSNEEILGAITKVKSISFPQQMVQKYMVENEMIQQNGQQQSQGSAQGIAGLPSQVGGC